MALCAGEKFGCTTFAVSDAVGGCPANMHAKGVMNHSLSKLFAFLVQSLETGVMGLYWVLAIGGLYLLS